MCLYYFPQYYAHREKMALINREKDIEKINRDALRMAREVADKTGTLMAGNICNSNAYLPDNPANDEKLKGMFKVTRVCKGTCFSGLYPNIGLL